MKQIVRIIFYTVIGVVASLFLLYKLWFLRLPDRNVPKNPDVFVSPANGVVQSVTYWDSDSLTIEKEYREVFKTFTAEVDTAGYLISIMMNVHNVHYQRAPVDSRLIAENYSPGKFNNAVKNVNPFGIRFENEHNTLLFETPEGVRFKIIQIAGFLARRIEDFVEPGQEVQQGEVIGVIKLGSQVSVVLPARVHVAVKPGDVLIDGETVIATGLAK